MQEVNRRFLNPIGLALTGSARDHGLELWVIDSRDVPGGIYDNQHNGYLYAQRRRQAARVSEESSTTSSSVG